MNKIVDFIDKLSEIDTEEVEEFFDAVSTDNRKITFGGYQIDFTKPQGSWLRQIVRKLY